MRHFWLFAVCNVILTVVIPIFQEVKVNIQVFTLFDIIAIVDI